MIAPIRSPQHEQDENAKLLARARRAIAQGLLSRTETMPPQRGVRRWAAWAFAAWSAAVAMSVVGMSWFWSFKPY